MPPQKPASKLTIVEERPLTIVDEQPLAEPPSRGGRAMPPTFSRPQDVGPYVVQGAKNLFRAVQANPEKTIEIAGPAAGAMMGATVGGPPGALLGAGAGYLYGKANRAASNVATGKPMSAGMPQTAGAAAWEPVEAIVGNALPDLAIPKIAGVLKAAGRDIVGRSVKPPISKINDMVEMGQRGTLPQDVRSGIAQDLIDNANRGGVWSPTSDANARNVVNRLKTVHDEGTDAVRMASEAGETQAMAPVVGEAGGYALAQARRSPTPSPNLAGVRGRIRDYMTDPESSLTVPFQNGIVSKPSGTLANEVSYASSKPFDDVPALQRVSFEQQGGPTSLIPQLKAVPGDEVYSRVEFGAKGGDSALEGVQYGPAPTTRIPNPEANLLDLLEKRRYMGGELRGSYGLDATQRAAQTMDKAWYRQAGDALKDKAPGLRGAMDEEHRLMNAMEALIPAEYMAGGNKPVNLYTFLGLASGDPIPLALGIGNYPYVMGGLGKSTHNIGARMAGEMPFGPAGKVSPLEASNLMRAALLRQKLAELMPQPPEE